MPDNVYLRYKEIIAEFNIPDCYEKIKMLNYNNKVFRMFLSDNRLCWFPHFSNRTDFDFIIQNQRIISIPYSSIQYYQQAGQTHEKIKIAYSNNSVYDTVKEKQRSPV